MLLNILIVLAVFVFLIVLHELGHFILAKKFGVKVEEFGVGLPPRLLGKKIGETLYSINLLPFGGFVKIKGEDEEIKEPGSFSEKPSWQRALITFGGILSFWLIAFLIFSLVIAIWGLSKSVPDESPSLAEVQIIQIAKNSPAEISGLKIGDKIIGVKTTTESNFHKTTKIREFQKFIQTCLGQEIILKVKREEKILDFYLIPRVNPSKNEGAIGIGLNRIVYIQVPWHEAPLKGFLVTAEITVQIPLSFLEFLKQTFQGKKVEGAEIVGPVGIGILLNQALERGLGNFLSFIGILSLWLAWVNVLPLPALDGGRLLFIGIEAIVRCSKKETFQTFQMVEQKITIFFFLFLLLLLILVTIKDIYRFIL